jgi:hypothetical protein
LETAPIKKQRPIFQNLIHSIGLHPTKIRLGLFSPPALPGNRQKHRSGQILEMQKATGTDGFETKYKFTKNQNRDSTILPLNANRTGWSIVVQRLR